MPRYSYLPNANGSCFSCPTLNCFLCNSSDPSTCLECVPGYVVSIGPNGTTCVLSSTLGCSAVNQTTGVCIECASHYALASNNSCVQCTTRAQACTGCDPLEPGVCSSCQNGFYLSSGVCYPCEETCLECTATDCTVPKPNTMLSETGTQVLKCLYPCDTCMNGNPSYCLSCKAGYSFSEGQCVQCDPDSKCKSCHPTDAKHCVSCFNYGFLTVIQLTQVCRYCDFPCLSCLGSSTGCTSCVDNYYLQNGTCMQRTNCSAMCAVCGEAGCIVCEPGYFVHTGSGNCLPGQPSCLVNN